MFLHKYTWFIILQRSSHHVCLVGLEQPAFNQIVKVLNVVRIEVQQSQRFGDGDDPLKSEQRRPDISGVLPRSGFPGQFSLNAG